MHGRGFLKVGRDLLQHGSEADLRTAAGRAYYALVQEAAEKLKDWGCRIPRDRFHMAIRLAFVQATISDLKRIGQTLEDLGRLRNQSDYQLDQPGDFARPTATKHAVQAAESTIALLDAIDADPARRAAAVADIQKNLLP
jgi:hypothetical protein